MRKLLKHLVNMAVLIVFSFTALPWIIHNMPFSFHTRGMMFSEIVCQEGWERLLADILAPQVALPLHDYIWLLTPLAVTIAIWMTVRLLFKKRPCGM